MMVRVVLGILCAVLLASSTNVDPLLKIYPNANWMMKSNIGNRTLQQITIPGTHDSASYSVIPVIVEFPEWIDAAIEVADKLGLDVGGIVDGWAKSQIFSIYEQYMYGIRYVDIRIILFQNAWVTHHGPVIGSASIQEILYETAQFVKNFPTEVLVLELSHADNNTSIAHQQEIISSINSILGPYLWPPSGGWVTIDTMVAAKKTVILTLTFGNDPKIWPANAIINSYANSPVLTTMEAYNLALVHVLNEHGPYKNQLYKLSWTLTPNVETILAMVIPNEPHNLLELALIADTNLQSWFTNYIEPLKFEYPILGNIFIIDDFSKSPVVEIVTKGCC